MNKSRVTVLMAVHDGGLHLAASVASVLAQTWREFEFLIIDDGSRDDSAKILRGIRDPRLRIETNERNLGLTASLNRGLALAAGELIARQDADDLSHPQRLEKQLDFLAANPSVVAAGSQCRLIDGAGRSLGRKDFPLTHAGIVWSHLWDNSIAHPAVIFRKAAVVAAGGYDESFRVSQDYELWSRLGERHALANLPERLATLRVLDTSITRQHRQPELIARVQREHWQRLFPGREASEGEMELVGLFRSRIPVDRLAEFSALFDELLGRYAAGAVPGRRSADVWRAVAMQLERVGYNLLPERRAAAWGELLRAVRAYPPHVFAMPWVRILALTVLGAGARGLYEKLTCKTP